MTSHLRQLYFLYISWAQSCHQPANNLLGPNWWLISRGRRFLGSAGDWLLQRWVLVCCFPSFAGCLLYLYRRDLSHDEVLQSGQVWGNTSPRIQGNDFSLLEPWNLFTLHQGHPGKFVTGHRSMAPGRRLSVICWSCWQSCLLLMSRVEAVRSWLSSASLQDCVGVSGAVEWILVSDTHSGNDQETSGHHKRRKVMKTC